MMTKVHVAAAAAVLAATLTACGGDKNGSVTGPTPITQSAPAPAPAPAPNPSPAPSPGASPTTGAPPTAVLVDSRSTATALAEEAKVAIDAAIKRSQAPTPAGQTSMSQASLSPAAVVTSTCPAGGSFTYDYPSTFGPGTTYRFVYNNCSYVAGYAIDGSWTLTYNTFANATNFAWTIVYNLRYLGYNFTYNGSQTCNYVNNVASCTFSDSGRTFATDFRYSNGVVNGTYQWTYASQGTVTYVFASWSATGGTIQVTGANGTSARIVRTGSASYSVTINGGTTYTIVA